MVKGNSGLLSLQESFGRNGGIQKVEQNAFLNLTNSPSKYGIKLDPQYLAEEQMKLLNPDQEGPDEKGASAIDYKRIKLLQASSDEDSNENGRRSKQSSISHDDYS